MSSSIFDGWLVDHYGTKPEKNQILIGYTVLDQPVEFGVKQMGHTLLSGMSRSGKTQMALNLLKSLIKFADIAIYTPKRNDYFIFRDKIKICGLEMALLLQHAVGEMERRNVRLLKESEKRGQIVQCEEKPMVFMIEEFQTFKELIDDATKKALSRLMSEGAGLNIFIYIITQVPSKRVLDGTLRENIMTDIAFRQRDAYGSRMAVGSNEAKDLELRHCIVRNVTKTFLVTHV